ncbi:MAG TPA: HWE histidine kinase domain-containing protein [Caulobacteraceae bacterium]|jgi:PAS domain S-box-containing protein
MIVRAQPRIWPFWSFTPAVAIGVAVSLLLVGLSMAIYNENLGKAEKLREVTVQADILSAGVTAALAFDDAKLAQEYVDALAANPDVESAGVYDLSGKLVAGYSRPGTRPPAANAVRAPSLQGDRIVVSQPVAQGATRLGSVYLRAVRESVARRATRYVGIAMLVVMAALIVIVLGVSNASLVETHDRLRVEMAERERTEEALRLSREAEAEAQLEIATERSRTALRQSEQQLEFALHAGRLGSWAIDLDTGRLTISEFFRENFGISHAEPLERLDQIDQYIHPEDREALNQTRERAIRDGTDMESEHRTLSPDGVVRWMLVRGRAVYDEHGVARRMAGVSLDITARKAAEERQRLLLDELNHRVKNTLATVQSIALQTGRDTGTGANFEGAFLARLGALARVHDLLSRVSWEGASLAAVVQQTLAPHLAAGDHNRLIVEGPDLRLGPNAAITLTMAFHELATNAAKYGALSVESGHVEVRWRMDTPSAPMLVEINWAESGGPPVTAPSRRGFGSRFIERGVAREFDGSVELDFAPVGVSCRMRLPLSIKLRMAA